MRRMSKEANQWCSRWRRRLRRGYQFCNSWGFYEDALKYHQALLELDRLCNEAPKEVRA